MKTLYLDQACLLCSKRPVRYLKTKGGFHKVCDSCREILRKAGLEEENLQVLPMSSKDEGTGRKGDTK